MIKRWFASAWLLAGIDCAVAPAKPILRVTGVEGAAFTTTSTGHSQPVRQGDELRPALHLRINRADDSVLLSYPLVEIELSGRWAIEKATAEPCESAVGLRPISGRIHYRSEENGASEDGCIAFQLGKATLVPGDGTDLRFVTVDGFTIGLLISGQASLIGHSSHAVDKKATLAPGEYFLIDPRARWLKHARARVIEQVIQEELRSLDGYRASVLHEALSDLELSLK